MKYGYNIFLIPYYCPTQNREMLVSSTEISPLDSTLKSETIMVDGDNFQSCDTGAVTQIIGNGELHSQAV